MILDYNLTCEDVDTIDQMVNHYISQRGSRQWPLAVFETLLDLAALNAYVLFAECTMQKSKIAKFLENLALQLVDIYASGMTKSLNINVALMNNLVTHKTTSYKAVVYHEQHN